MLATKTEMQKGTFVDNSKIVHGSSPLFYLGKLLWVTARSALMLALAFILLYPIIFMVSMAFRTLEDIYDPTIVWIPRHITLENFVMVNKAINYLNALKNTLLISLISPVLQVFTCALTGYGLARFKFRGKNILVILMLFMIVVPPQMVSLPNYLLFQNLDFFGIIKTITGASSGISILNSMYSFYLLAAFGVGIRSGIFILIFMQFFKNMPVELENAAMVDGCGFTKTYFRIMLPNARMIMLVAFLFSFVWYWNDYYQASIYCPTMPTVSTALANLMGSLGVIFKNSNIDPYWVVTIQQACCVLTIAPLLIVYIFTQRYFTESIERSGIVG